MQPYSSFSWWQESIFDTTIPFGVRSLVSYSYNKYDVSKWVEWPTGLLLFVVKRIVSTLTSCPRQSPQNKHDHAVCTYFSRQAPSWGDDKLDRHSFTQIIRYGTSIDSCCWLLRHARTERQIWRQPASITADFHIDALSSLGSAGAMRKASTNSTEWEYLDMYVCR